MIPIIPSAPAAENPQRRGFLKIMAASMALAGAGCKGPPQEKIVPYVNMPENMVPGQPLFYATAFTRRGYAQGVLVECNMGRPTKVEGNPHHPSSLGATDAFTQASILQLWDPDRSQAVHAAGMISTWEAFQTALAQQQAGWDADGGRGLRILAGTVGSPTLAGQVAGLVERYPDARWHAYEPLHDDLGLEAARLAFGQPADTVYRFDAAAIVVCLDADVFGDWPGAIRYARDFMRQRRSDAPAFSSRLYALESNPGLTGAIADNRLALAPRQIEALAWRLAARLGLPGIPPGLPPVPGPEAARWEMVLAKRLAAHRGASLVVAGGAMSAATRALAHRLNDFLGNTGQTVMRIAPIEAAPQNHADSVAVLAADMHAGAVRALIILDANPVYTAPADIDFAGALAKVPFSVHLGLYRDETARSASWHIPLSHAYEAWSDALAHDGSATIAQPVIAPLYDSRSAHELLAVLTHDEPRLGHDLVRRYWSRRQGTPGFEGFWQEALWRGIVPGSAHPPLRLGAASPQPRLPLPPSFDSPPLAGIFAPDPASGDGDFANNAWLQELPRPLTKLTWDNAALLSTATAGALGLETGDVVRLGVAGDPKVRIEAPVWVLPGHADGTLTLPLGYGRRAAGRVGNGVGFDAYRLRTRASAGGAFALSLEKTGRRHAFATTQNHARMEGRDIVRTAPLEEFRRHPHFANDARRERVPDKSLYPPVPYPDHKWGMAIDLNACIGCNACTIACQAENNIPVVGKEQVIRGREMHWIRVDRYYSGPDARPRTLFQPVPCMHCENAPCEEVCPVGATVHDSGGLNVQVYNRCVGTRFCSNNCPYKVRRFNFLQYANTGIASLKALQNPDVTVRRRGVMEKCNYCLQRITRARLDAEKLRRPLRDGEVVTACQAVCPTAAIVFGDLNDPASRVNRAKASPLDYTLLAELNTRPRTTYAARVINGDPELEP
jgi:molybdopterin-containing oxidoreductase family iron-sulfur binding subunit